VAYLIRLRLVKENSGRLTLTDIGGQRYRALPKGAGIMAVETEDEAAAVVANYIFRLVSHSAGCDVALSDAPKGTCPSLLRSIFMSTPRASSDKSLVTQESALLRTLSSAR
jgi:hypothetical protein